ncbi:hypothetical protein [Streptomyces griseocarneus]|uniref:hypothetical protein n=1 Tax=Streptomyces griseocarneus TaxID=51201 RepID=UPI00167CFBB0|nr:hypothetical protein [Streptomyces griseocarneus]MBZ6476681.1 hypothetical protein [Streptomyces griseocarneus]
MSTPPETPSPRSLAREAAGLLLVAAGVLVVLVALGAMHPVLSSSVAAAGTFAALRFLAPPRTKVSRAVTCTISTIVVAAAVGCAFAYFPLLGWVEVGTALAAAGVWLASEGA